MKYYAGIGSRSTPINICDFMEWVGSRLAVKGYVLRSGGAEGADASFENGADDYRCDTKHDYKEIFRADQKLPLWTGVFVEHFHPAPEKLEPFPRKLMQRNAMQILGEDGNTPVKFVICWTKDGKDSGGTGQAIRIAQYYYIPVYNLYFDETKRKIERGLI